MKKLCVLCKHFNFSGGSPGYCELTPGTSGDMSCNKNVWNDDMDYMSTDRFREIMLTAEKCLLFEVAEDLKDITK